MAVRVGILGAAGYTGGELIRLLINHPEAQIVFANSESNAGNLVADVHEGLYGDTDLRFTAEMPFEEVDVVFFCFGHGKSEAFLKEHEVPRRVKIIDLAQDFRLAGKWLETQHPTPEAHASSTGCRKSTGSAWRKPGTWPTRDASPPAYSWDCCPPPRWGC